MNFFKIVSTYLMSKMKEQCRSWDCHVTSKMAYFWILAPIWWPETIIPNYSSKGAAIMRLPRDFNHPNSFFVASMSCKLWCLHPSIFLNFVWARDLPNINFQFGDLGRWRLNRFTDRIFQNILQSSPFFIVRSCLDLPRENPTKSIMTAVISNFLCL